MRLSKLWRSGYGRKDGWDIELDGQVVGTLTEPEYADMFWVSYRVSQVHESTGAVLADPENWRGCLFRYRSRSMGEYAEHAFSAASGRAYPHGSRVCMRRLYLLPRSWWERAADFVASFLRW
jgi:hypothetical protein